MLCKKSVIVLFLAMVFSCGFFAQAAAKEEKPYTVINTADLKSMKDHKQKEIVVIDARNPEEYEDVHIPGAINIPQKKFEQYESLLPKEKTTILVFYCNGVKWGKSKKAAVKAATMGYSDVMVYAEGMPVWEEASYPIVKGPNYEAKIETSKMPLQDLNSLIKAGEDGFVVVDVRDASEYAEGHIPGAINIPVASFASRSGELDKKKTIIVYCNAGNRSYKAYRKLRDLGYKKYYQLLFTDWKEAGFQVNGDAWSKDHPKIFACSQDTAQEGNEGLEKVDLCRVGFLPS